MPPPALHAASNSVTQINYLAKARAEKLRLIEGDSESFGDILGMIDDYEGVSWFFIFLLFSALSITPDPPLGGGGGRVLRKSFIGANRR